MNKPFSERHGRWLAIVVVLVAMSNLGLGSPCTRTTCPPGPVMAIFKFPNCTGEPSFIPIEPPRGKWGLCFKVPGITFSFLDYYTSEYLDNSGYLSDDCGLSGSGATKVGERFYFGNCFASAGMMYLANVNQSFVSPQPPEKNPRPQPPFLPIEKPCSNKASCSGLGDTFTQHFSDATCSDKQSDWTVETNVKLHTCYQKDKFSYVSRRCMGPHTFEQVEFLDSDCTRPFSSVIVGYECGYYNYGETSYCTQK